MERRRSIRAVRTRSSISARSPGGASRCTGRREPRRSARSFTRLFGDLLEQSYISKIENYSGEKIQYLGETVDGDRAVVRTLIVNETGHGDPRGLPHVPAERALAGVRRHARGPSASSPTTARSSTRSSSAPATLISSRSSRRSTTSVPGRARTGPRGETGSAAATAPPPSPRQSPSRRRVQRALASPAVLRRSTTTPGLVELLREKHGAEDEQPRLLEDPPARERPDRRRPPRGRGGRG